MHNTTRRQWLTAIAAASACAALPAWASSNANAVEVWKDPSCGCCHDWITHMQDNGFAVTAHDTGNTAVRAKLGLPPELGSCHTALIGGYVIEGHVPASDVRKLLAQKPKALGLTVPGMVIGSPGMDTPAYNGRQDPYDVLLVTKKMLGSGVNTSVFSSYRHKTG